jgi:hypothetical protein
MTWVSRGGETVRVRLTARTQPEVSERLLRPGLSLISVAIRISASVYVGTNASGPDESEHHASSTPADEPPTWCPVDPQGVNRLRLARMTQHDGLRESLLASGEKCVDPTESDHHGEDGGDVSGRAYGASHRMRV